MKMLLQTNVVSDSLGANLESALLGLRPANERRRYKVTPTFIGCVQTYNQPCIFVSRWLNSKVAGARINDCHPVHKKATFCDAMITKLPTDTV